MKLDRLTLWLLGASLSALVACGGSSSQPDSTLPDNTGPEDHEDPGGGDPDEPTDEEQQDDQGPGEDDTAPQAQHWEWVHPGPQGYNLNALINDGSHFVAVGNSGAIMHSTDGEAWRNVHYYGGIHLRDVAYNGERYVAVGQRVGLSESGPILYSEDGETWHTSSLEDYDSTLNSVVWTDNSFVAMGNRDSSLLRSQDGISWTEESAEFSAGTSGQVRTLATNGQTLIAGSVSQIDTSYNEGFDWTDSENFANTGGNRTFRSAIFDGENFVAVGGFNTYGLVFSRTGEDWDNKSATAFMFNSTPRKNEFRDVVRAEDHYWVTDDRGSIDKVPVASNEWSPALETPYVSPLNGIDFLDGTWVAAGDNGRIVHSDDGDVWHELRAGEGDGVFSGLAKNADGRMVAVRGEDPLVYSDDGENWTEVALPEDASELHAITTSPDGSRFVAVGHMTIATSTDAENWEVNNDFNLYFDSVAVSDDKWLIGNYHRLTNRRSLDIIHCTNIDDCEAVEGPGFASAINWHDGHFVLAERRFLTSDPRIHRSTTGEDWDTVGDLALSQDDRYSIITHLAHNDEAMVLLRTIEPDDPKHVDVSVSLDGGANWQAVTLEADLDLATATVVTAGDTLVISDHENNRAWMSDDGVQWEYTQSAHRIEGAIESEGIWYAIAGAGILQLQ